MHFNILLPFASRSSKLSPYFRIPYQKSRRNLSSPCLAHPILDLPAPTISSVQHNAAVPHYETLCVKPTMKKTAKCSSETPVLIYQQDHIISFHRSENLKSRTPVTCLKLGELFDAGNK
jgi:hypothetical protein